MTTSHTSSPRAILTTSDEERERMIAYIEEQIQTGYVPLTYAAKQTGLPFELLYKLVREGVLKGDIPRRTTKGTPKGECDLQQARELAEKLEMARKPVEGNGILATEAEKKYSFDVNSIYNWHRAGWIQIVSGSGKRDRLFNEGDIAFARALADLSGHQQGKPVFPQKIYQRGN